MRIVCAFVGAVLCFSGCDGTTENKRTQLPAGKWDIVAIEQNGSQVYSRPKIKGAGKYITVQGKQILRPIGERREWKYALDFDAKYKIDGSKEPNRIDIEFVQGPEKGKTRRGVYMIVGDVLIICLGTPDGDRATAFSTKRASKEILFALIRADW